ncbi:MAG: M24 family metallopeptidase [Bacteroidota bacterium]|nr:M24 family metallopeptidase [Candidatus Kapabacteria bacterium]MDW8219437.1 M24 family metallopeptidase [Bacteroidota bacterium]
MMDIRRIQAVLSEQEIDAWLLYDFRHSNPVAWQTLELPPETHCSRRWAVIVPAEGEAVKIVHSIEAHTLAGVPAREMRYTTRSDWEQALRETLGKHRRIALEYSPRNAIPVVSWVDAGTVEWLREQGYVVESSAEIIQQYSAVWSKEQFEENVVTAKLLRTAMMRCFSFIREHMLAGEPLTEYQVQQEIGKYFDEYNLVSYSLPNISVNANAANPHYQPTAEHSAELRHGDVVLVDMWAKPRTPHGVYADITWMAYLGEHVPERPATLFSVIATARDAALQLLRDNLPHKPVRGCDVDDACRAVVEKAGFGQYFIHRTGHSITTETHGWGANMDNFETHDTRRIVPMTSFSIEPGIYIPGEIGLRTEVNVVINERGEVIVTGGEPQQAILPLLAPQCNVQAFIKL